LAGFFGSYYAWLSAITMFGQLWLTGRLLMGLGLTPSLLLLPLTLLAGSMGLLVWPGLFAATATRMAEASLRTSVNRSGVEILYLPIPDFIKKKVKVFLDVTVECVFRSNRPAIPNHSGQCSGDCGRGRSEATLEFFS
jgi:hypothetical protein